MSDDDLLSLVCNWGGVEQNSLRGWCPIQFPKTGEPEAIAIISGSEIHFCVNPKSRHRVIQKARTIEFLRPLFDRYGYLTTSVQHGDHKAESFVTRLGFVETWADKSFTHFMMLNLPFEPKEKKCHQSSPQ